MTQKEIKTVIRYYLSGAIEWISWNRAGLITTIVVAAFFGLLVRAIVESQSNLAKFKVSCRSYSGYTVVLSGSPICFTADGKLIPQATSE